MVLVKPCAHSGVIALLRRVMRRVALVVVEIAVEVARANDDFALAAVELRDFWMIPGRFGQRACARNVIGMAV